MWDDAPLFPETIRAWRNGPVCGELYNEHRGRYEVAADMFPGGNADALTGTQRDTVLAVLRAYGDKSSQWLSDLTHAEAPWRDARALAGEVEPPSPEITHAAMAEYYSALNIDTSAQALG